MDKFIYLHSLDDIKNGLSERQDYHLYHLVDDINLRYVSLQGDFVTFINEEDEKQMFSLAHMYTKKRLDLMTIYLRHIISVFMTMLLSTMSANQSQAMKIGK